MSTLNLSLLDHHKDMWDKMQDAMRASDDDEEAYFSDPDMDGLPMPSKNACTAMALEKELEDVKQKYPANYAYLKHMNSQASCDIDFCTALEDGKTLTEAYKCRDASLRESAWN